MDFTSLKSLARRATAVVAAAGLGLGLALTGGPARAADAPTLKIAIVADIDSFNPFTTILAVPININRMQYEALVEWGPDMQPTGGLAEKWESSPDGKVWTFTMPEGRTWSDGTPITAEDAAFTYKAIRDNEKLSAANGSLLDNQVSEVAKDKNTFVITLKSAQATNPGLDMPIVPKHVWEKVGDMSAYSADAADGKPVVGSGPYFITKHAKGQSVELKANEKFHRGAPKIAGITYVYYKNTDAAVQGLRSGEIDLVSGLTSAQFKSLENQPNIKTSNGSGRRYQALAINPGAVDIKGQPMGDGHEFLKDPQVRKALLMAVNNQELLDKVVGGLGKLGKTQIPTVFPEYFGLPAGVEERKFDLAGANKILDDAGYAKGSDGIRAKNGKKMEFRLLGRSTASEHTQMAEFITAWYKEIGVATKVSMVSNTQVNNDSTLGKYDLYFTGWGIGPDPDYQLSINQCKSRPNADGSGATSENNWCSPEFDKLYTEQHAELDKAKRAELVKQAFGEIYKANVLNVIYYGDTLEAYRSDRFKDFQRQPEGKGPIYGQSGYWGLYSATPVDGNGSSEGGAWYTKPVFYVPAALLVIAAIAVPVVLNSRKKGDDRE